MTDRRPVILAARRTVVAPRGGAFAGLDIGALAGPAIAACLEDAGLEPGAVDHVVLGNGLYGGGNPARFAALAARLPDQVPALTIDTQCCAGLDAVALAARLVAAGAAEIVLAGGVESWSRSPLRMTRPLGDEAPVAYDRPPFAPDRDVDMAEAAAALARDHDVSRTAQEAYAVESHRRALAAREAGRLSAEIAAQGLPLAADAFTRRLTPALCARLPSLAGAPRHAVTAATAAVEADAAAVVLVAAAGRGRAGPAIVDALSRGGDPAMPAYAPVPAIRALLKRNAVGPDTLAATELMEAYAAQALVNIAETGLDPARVNRSGGALARGHPIGASGAVLAVRLWHELAAELPGALGLAAIAGAGGLASAVLVRR